ncbi:MAG TPA: glycosyltransferase family 39 protein [Pirellulales bacterium]|nr:glycosyltransferase family 39 protein [Pirellulales bacterium]
MSSVFSSRWRQFGWLEPQLGVLVFIVAGVYFTRLGEMTLRGEETRRARVAIEMLETGDWVVPHEQGRLFPDRPPLGNWLIALSMLATGSQGVVAVRLPTVLATLATTFIIYGYSRRFLSANGALVAGLAYATMGQVLSLGMLAETEATFTLLVGASLLLWHAAYRGGLPAWQTWCLGYVLAGLAALAKGPQGPIYFAAATTVYLFVRRDWRFWLSWPHLLGIAAGVTVVAVWQVPYSLVVDWPHVLQTWGHTSAARFDYSSPWPVIKHLLSFPCEIAGCLLPWSVWLLAYLHRDFRRSLGAKTDPVMFLSIVIALAFPTCWLAPQARGRYFMPLYPCFAPLIGIVIQQAWATEALAAVRTLWRRYMAVASLVMLATGCVVVAASFAGLLATTPFYQPAAFAIIFLLLVMLLAAVLWRARSPAPHNAAVAGVVGLALFLGLTFNGLVMNDAIRRSDDLLGQVATLKKQLPPDVRLVSFGRSHHPFVYYYGETIPWLDWPKSASDAADCEYFCFHSMNGRRKPLPFDWEEIALIRCDRYRRSKPVDAVVVGRRILPNEVGRVGPASGASAGPPRLGVSFQASGFRR